MGRRLPWVSDNMSHARAPDRSNRAIPAGEAGMCNIDSAETKVHGYILG